MDERTIKRGEEWGGEVALADELGIFVLPKHTHAHTHMHVFAHTDAAIAFPPLLGIMPSNRG